ncbi:MAG TPA: hypothetical protein VFL41_10915 [Gaiellaceae bacterium]|nr:hypothetical protein [Gaiellaceae bacterium]
MFRVRLLAALLGALVAGLAVATIAVGSGAESATPGRDHVFGAGTFGPGCWEGRRGTLCVPYNYTVRLLGISEGESGRARGVMERRNNVLGGTFLGEVTCMTVNGNEAAVGGVLISTPSGDFVGDPFLLYVRDRGILGDSDGSEPDQISALAAFPPGDPDLSLMPGRFPEVCPAADSLYGYLPLTAGDITAAVAD